MENRNAFGFIIQYGLLEEAESIRDRKRLAGMLQAGDKILDLQRQGTLICFLMEHRSYGEDKTTFALSREKTTFHCKKCIQQTAHQRYLI